MSSFCVVLLCIIASGTMAGEGTRRRTSGRTVSKDVTQVRKTPITALRSSLPTTTRKRKRFASSFEVNGQQFSTDFDAALYIILESKSLTLRSFMDAALQEQKRLAKQNWKLALLQDHSLKNNKYAGRLVNEALEVGVKAKKHDNMSSNDAMSMDEVSTDSEPESVEIESQAFAPSLEDCTSEEEDASPEAPKRKIRQRKSTTSGNNSNEVHVGSKFLSILLVCRLAQHYSGVQAPGEVVRKKARPLWAA